MTTYQLTAADFSAASPANAASLSTAPLFASYASVLQLHTRLALFYAYSVPPDSLATNTTTIYQDMT